EVGEQREFLEAYEIDALARGEVHGARECGAVLAGIGVPAMLHQRHAKRWPIGLVHARGRVGHRVVRQQEDGLPPGTGTGWVMQCTPPPPYARAVAGTGTTVRPAKQASIVASAWSSYGSPLTGTTTAPLHG